MLLTQQGFPRRNRPHVVTRAREFPAGDQAGELLEQEPAFASTAEAELTDELFVSGFTASRATNPGEQVSVASAGQIPISAWVMSTGHGLRRAYAGSEKDAYWGRFTTKGPESNRKLSAGREKVTNFGVPFWV
jgi:hypothetical protein